MSTEPIPPMSDMPFPPVSSQRKVIAMAVAAVFVVSLGLAFVFGGKKSSAARNDSQDTQIGTLTNLAALDLSAQATPGDWFDGMPAGTEASANPNAETSRAGQAVSSVVTGDNATSPGTIADNGGRNTPAVTKAESSTSALPSVAATTQPGANDSRLAVADSSAKTSASGQPLVASAEKNKASGNTVSPTTTSAALAAKSGESNAGQAGTKAKTVAVKTSGPRRQESKPVFVRPARKQSGVIAQTRTLITEEQFHPSSKPAKPAAAAVEPVVTAIPVHQPTAVPAEEPVPKAIPVHVLQQEARTYAARTDSQLRQKGTLNDSEHIRLPKRSEADNPTIWHDEDKPTAAEERRPFGLVLSDEKSAFTPEGIPLRADVPAGASPLEKTGADKPLWKRPE